MTDPGNDIEATDETLSINRARMVNEACEWFEKVWRSGGRPTIEDALAGAGSERRALLRELLVLEVELRRGEGEQPRADEYCARFPSEANIVEAVFQDAEPERIADFELLGELGRGGMGVVYLTRQAGLNRRVALKVMRTGRLATEVEARRFRIEAEAIAGLRHPNIVQIFEVGCWQGLHYFSMELIEGGNLSKLGPALQRDPRASAILLLKIARAVEHAHRRGFVHRDLKPSNILLDDETAAAPEAREPFVTDFGLVKRVGTGPGAGPTRTDVIVGTLEYMAPEQAQGGPIDARTDVYGLGAVLYAMLTGRPPLRADSPMETLVLVTEKEPEPPRWVNPGVPKDLEWICLRCLEKTPGRRYPTAEAVAEDLERFLKNEPVEARRTGALDRFRRWCRREPEFAYRLIVLGAVTALTQANYLAVPPEIRQIDFHTRVTVAELLWLLVVVVLHLATRGSNRPERIWPAWVVVDVTALTLLIRILDGANSILVIGYPLIVAVSGLWSRVWLVWLATGLSVIGFGLLWGEYVTNFGFERNHYLDVVMASLLCTGLVVSHQVRRFWALSRYHGTGPGPG